VGDVAKRAGFWGHFLCDGLRKPFGRRRRAARLVSHPKVPPLSLAGICHSCGCIGPRHALPFSRVFGPASAVTRCPGKRPAFAAAINTLAREFRARKRTLGNWCARTSFEAGSWFLGSLCRSKDLPFYIRGRTPYCRRASNTSCACRSRCLDRDRRSHRGDSRSGRLRCMVACRTHTGCTDGRRSRRSLCRGRQCP